MNTEKQLLRLILATTESIAPKSMELHGEWKSWLFAIGSDHTAELLMDDDAYEELVKRCLGES